MDDLAIIAYFKCLIRMSLFQFLLIKAALSKIFNLNIALNNYWLYENTHV